MNDPRARGLAFVIAGGFWSVALTLVAVFHAADEVGLRLMVASTVPIVLGLALAFYGTDVEPAAEDRPRASTDGGQPGADKLADAVEAEGSAAVRDDALVAALRGGDE